MHPIRVQCFQFEYFDRGTKYQTVPDRSNPFQNHKEKYICLDPESLLVALKK